MDVFHLFPLVCKNQKNLSRQSLLISNLQMFLCNIGTHSQGGVHGKPASCGG